MNTRLKSFIDNFIRENIKGDMRFGYGLHVECDISKAIQDELIKVISELDSDSVRKVILDHAQNLIDERMPIVESEDRYEIRLSKYVDRINGEVRYI
jgi:hypothetical protein